jgi:hypothetical protein
MIVMISLVQNTGSYIDRTSKKSIGRGSHSGRGRVSVPVDVIEISPAARAAAGRDATGDDEFFQALESAEQLIDQSEALSAEENPEKAAAPARLCAYLALVEPSEETREERFDSVA